MATCAVFSQTGNLTFAERKWIDSLNTLYGAQNSWFDSLMQRDGNCVRGISEAHRQAKDTSCDVLHFYRELHPGVIVYDAPSMVFFDYYSQEKKIITPEMEMYLRPEGPFIVQFGFGIWGQYTTSMLVRTSRDTLYRNTAFNHRDTVLPGFNDPSKFVIVTGGITRDPVIAAVKIAAKGIALNDHEGNACRLYACTYVSAHFPALAETYPVFRDTFYVLTPDSVLLQKDEIVFGEWETRWTRDEKRQIDFQYFRLQKRFTFSPGKLERVVLLREMEISRQFISPKKNKKEEHAYRKFVKGDPETNDPSGIYTDPVLRWLYRHRKFTPSPSR